MAGGNRRSTDGQIQAGDVVVSPCQRPCAIDTIPKTAIARVRVFII
jgi:hypothetical protein